PNHKLPHAFELLLRCRVARPQIAITKGDGNECNRPITVSIAGQLPDAIKIWRMQSVEDGKQPLIQTEPVVEQFFHHRSPSVVAIKHQRAAKSHFIVIILPRPWRTSLN